MAVGRDIVTEHCSHKGCGKKPDYVIEVSSLRKALNSDYCFDHVIDRVKETPKLSRVSVYTLDAEDLSSVEFYGHDIDRILLTIGKPQGEKIFSSWGLTLGRNLPRLERIVSREILSELI